MMGYVAVWGGLGFLLTSALVAEDERSRIRFERVLGVVGYLKYLVYCLVFVLLCSDLDRLDSSKASASAIGY